MNKNIKIIVNYFVGPLLFLIIVWNLYRQVILQPDLAQRWEDIKHSWHHPVFWAAVALLVLNWGIESRKWQILLTSLGPYSFLKAVKGVLAGCSVTMVTPNRVGEFGGRILFVQPQDRIAAIPLTFIGSIAQAFVTFFMGVAGMVYFKFFTNNFATIFPGLTGVTINLLMGLSIVICFFLLFVYAKLSWFATLLLRLNIPLRFVKYVVLMRKMPGKKLLRILVLSCARYLVFILQFILILQAMKVEIEVFTCFWLLSVFYLLMALAPTIGFAELPLRSFASAELLKGFSNNVVGIQATSLTIWFLNLMIPALVGSILILGVKIIKDRNEEIV